MRRHTTNMILCTKQSLSYTTTPLNERMFVRVPSHTCCYPANSPQSFYSTSENARCFGTTISHSKIVNTKSRGHYPRVSSRYNVQIGVQRERTPKGYNRKWTLVYVANHQQKRWTAWHCNLSNPPPRSDLHLNILSISSLNSERLFLLLYDLHACLQ